MQEFMEYKEIEIVLISNNTQTAPLNMRRA